MAGVHGAVLILTVLAVLRPVQAQNPVGVDSFQPIPECIEQEPGTETPLVEVICSGVDLGTTTLICRGNSILRGWMLDDTTWAEGSVMNECKFSRSNLNGLSFTNGEIAVEGSSVVSFDDCDISGLSIIDSRGRLEVKGSRTTADNVTLSGGEFNETTFLNGITFNNINMKNSVFRDVLFDGLNGEGLENGLSLTDDRLTLHQLNAEGVQLLGGASRFRWTAITGDDSTMVGIVAKSVVFEFCDMTGTDLTSADFKSGNITDSTFTGVTMKETILDNAGIKNWRVVDSKISTLQMSNAFYVDDCGDGKCPSVEMTRTNISDSLFFNSDLRRGRFTDCIIAGSTFNEVEFFSEGDGANFSGTTFTDTNFFIGADLRNSDFTNVANLDSVLFEDAYMGGVMGLPNEQDCEEFCSRKSCLCEDPPGESYYYDDDDNNVQPDCFPGSSVVTAVDKSGEHFEKPLDRLEVGDTILDGSNELKSEVFFFSHRDDQARETFLEIETEHGSRLTVTRGHYVYANANEMLPARSIKPMVHSLIRSDGSLSLVSRVRIVRAARGLYAPHSTSGNLIVDGFKVSCYTEAVPPKLGHVILLPVRLIQLLLRGTGRHLSLDLGGRSIFARPVLRVLSAVMKSVYG